MHEPRFEARRHRLAGRRSRDLGFSIDQVRKLLDLVDQRERSCEAVDLVALQHVTEIDRKIRDLQALLERMLKECQGGTIAECRIIEALSPLNDRD
jgi:DNA-binding transcriptional MerR regulator